MSTPSSSARPQPRSLAALVAGTDFELAPIIMLDRSVAAVGFDGFRFEPVALHTDVVQLERGADPAGSTIAVASVAWADMPIRWAALQSRAGLDHLGLREQAEPFGDVALDDAFVVDIDDAVAFGKVFTEPVRSWLVDFDHDHGPLAIVLDGGSGAPSRLGARPHIRAVYVARIAATDDALVETASLATIVVERLRQGDGG